MLNLLQSVHSFMTPGTFHFEAAFEGKEVKISNGVVNLSGYASVADLEF